MKRMIYILLAILVSGKAFSGENNTAVEDTFNKMNSNLIQMNKNADAISIGSNGASSISLSAATISALQLSLMSTGVAALSAAGIGVTTAAGSGYFFGKLLVESDKVYFNGKMLDQFGKLMSPIFFVTYKAEVAISTLKSK